MRIFRAACLLIISISVLTPLAAAFDLGAFGGYGQSNLKVDSSAGVVSNNSFRGAHFGISGHYLHKMTEWLSLGGGPYFLFAPSMAYTGEVASANSIYSNTGFSIGIEAQAKILAVPFVNPYLKAGFGSEALRSLGTFPGFSIETRFSGSGYRLLAGVDMPIGPLIFIFAEGGLTGAWYDVTVGSTSGGTAQSTGFVANLGGGISF